ncbi:hypothetical protein KP78_15920 [Jeotgalibacillus soli]|uniref:Uncharacterized protein n=1 Tax=Jeotgalibacillus soli TaxID=889306 RepID=A0A0C2RCZ4_9BACL|nr:hypothetical protein KP78_15920 [Jeotgalibacillus soli]
MHWLAFFASWGIVAYDLEGLATEAGSKKKNPRQQIPLFI